jgi:hypothetical protein
LVGLGASKAEQHDHGRSRRRNAETLPDEPLLLDGRKMTAEIAILNKSAIAVAADSAVTRGNNKVHITANKIFRISQTLPLGLMVYGNADVFGMPWEVLAKLYRDENGTKSHSSVIGAAQDFIAFITGPRFVNDDIKEGEMINIAYDVAMKLHRVCSGKTKILRSASFSEEIKSLTVRVEARGLLENYAVPDDRAFAREYGALCREVLREVFDEDSRLSIAASKPFPELVRKVTEHKFFSSYLSGFVVFGFGADDFLPVLQHFHVDGAPYGKPRISPTDATFIKRSVGEEVSVLAFAQRDTASLFMEGVSSSTKTFFLKAMRLSLEKFGNKIFKEFTDASKITSDEAAVYNALFVKEINAFTNTFTEEVDNYLNENSVSRILYALDGIGKEDMAKLAESLVEITSLKMRVSRDVETVGGPIDVAVLSKTDGFIWIKRKHYFQPELNSHYFQRQREKSHG